MDQIQREKIAAKLKKIKALAERGVGGEKETAMRMYEDLKARYELEDEEIMLDAVTLHWFGYATELEEELLTQIFYKVTGGTTYHIYTGKYSRRKKGGIVMGYMDKTLKQTVPYYSTMKRAGAFRQPQKPQKRQKRTTLTEYSQNGQKAVLKPHVTVNQAAKKLYDYEQTGLSPHEVANLVEQVQNLTRRVKKYESWEE